MRRASLLLHRRSALASFAGLAAGLGAGRSAAQPRGWSRQVTDLLGRQVTIPAQPRAVLLGEGFQLLNLALVHPDPASILIGMGGELKRVAPILDADYRRAFPALSRVPELTAAVGQGFSAERALALRPDLVILSAWQANSEEMRRVVALLEGSGVPVIYIDIFQQPGRNTVPTVRLLGAALGQEERAEAYARFYEERRDRILRRVAESGRPGPRVLFSAFAGRWPCCWSPGTGGGGGEFLAMLGARNVAEGLINNPRGGTLAAEQVLLSGAEVFVGTGIYLPGEGTGIQVGPGAPADAARASLEAVLRAAEFATLPAVGARRAHGLWNAFNGAAINIVQLEALARWIRPELFGELDPAATLAEINARFAAVPYEGAYWTSLG
ncbi:ABC transporter substrate-binding protein [Muricoccus roseus]|nr:ABC transporter substrate-binding protein [Roseomonas rosea]